MFEITTRGTAGDDSLVGPPAPDVMDGGAGDEAFERFTDEGPLALLPMSEGRCAVVWTVRDEQVGEVLALDDESLPLGDRSNMLYRGTLVVSGRGQGRVEKTKKLSVKVPPGVDTGDRIRLAGEGEAGAAGGPAGDLFVQVSVRQHPIFERDGKHLYCEVPITFVDATLGGELEDFHCQGVPTKRPDHEGNRHLLEHIDKYQNRGGEDAAAQYRNMDPTQQR